MISIIFFIAVLSTIHFYLIDFLLIFNITHLSFLHMLHIIWPFIEVLFHSLMKFITSFIVHWFSSFFNLFVLSSYLFHSDLGFALIWTFTGIIFDLIWVYLDLKWFIKFLFACFCTILKAINSYRTDFKLSIFLLTHD